VSYLRYYHSVILDRLGKTTKKEGIVSLESDSIPGHPIYETGCSAPIHSDDRFKSWENDWLFHTTAVVMSVTIVLQPLSEGSDCDVIRCRRPFTPCL
jgi:hypothetical protein